MNITTNEPSQLARLRKRLGRQMEIEAKAREARKAEREAIAERQAYLNSPEYERLMTEQLRLMVADVRRIMRDARG